MQMQSSVRETRVTLDSGIENTTVQFLTYEYRVQYVCLKEEAASTRPRKQTRVYKFDSRDTHVLYGLSKSKYSRANKKRTKK